MAPLTQEQNLLLAFAAKAAILSPPNGLVDTASWWVPLGANWLRALCDRLSINSERLPDSPTVDDARALAPSLPDAVHGDVATALLTATLLVSAPTAGASSSGAKQDEIKIASDVSRSSDKAKAVEQFVYTASTRAYICRTLELLDISYRHLLSVEMTLSKELYQKVKEAEMMEGSEELRKKKEQGWGGKWGRALATAGGVTLGGVLLGVTGGLAAPALVPLLPFLTAGTAPVLLGSLFGLAGGGLTGYRVRRRWGGVERFAFVEISGPGEGEGDVSLKQSDKKKAPSVITAMLIPGMQVTSETETIDASKRCRDLFAPYEQDVYVVSHFPDVMLETGKAVHGWVMSQLYTRAGKEILKRTAFNAMFAAVSMPLTIYKTTGLLVDNQWIRGTDKARKAGLLLADVIREKVHGNRPLILIGSSLGAIVLFEALLSLASTSKSNGTEGKDAPLVDSAIFISLPQAPSKAQWKTVRGVVGRRVVNAYCKSDFVLAGVGRLHEVLGGANVGGITGMAGLQATPDDVGGIENVDIGDIIEGHLSIPEKMPEILSKIGMDQ